MKIGIIGYGFVGRAVASAYDEEHYEVLINDPLIDSTSINEMKQRCDAIFICVPTPQSADGSCDTSILENVLCQLDGYTGLVISKSTATPQVYADLESKYSNLKFAHVPEFLTAKNAIYDYLCPIQIVIGCREELRQDVFNAITTTRILFDFNQVNFCSIAEAAMFKYVANTMLAMKVVINNEFYDLCNALGIDWNNITKIAFTDPRLGNTHWAVPGPDGSRGFGGACFPKDTQALLSLSKFLNIDMSMLDAAISKNGRLLS